jgi:hypothetical protein
MSVLAAFLAIVEDWRNVFPQQRTFQRGVRQALGSLVCLGRRCLTRIIWTMAARIVVGARSTSSTPAAGGSRKNCSGRS